MNTDEFDFPSLLVFNRCDVNECIITAKNLDRFNSRDDIKGKCSFKCNNASVKTVKEISDKLKKMDKYNKSLEIKLHRENEFRFPIDPTIIYILLTRDSNESDLNKHLSMVENKYPNAKIVFVNLENKHIPHKSPSSKESMEHISYVSLTITLENIRYYNKGMYQRIIDGIGYKYTRRNIGNYTFITPKTNITNKLLRGKKKIINAMLNFESSYIVTYGCGLGDDKLSSLLPCSLKTKRDTDIDGKESNKIQFLNCCNLCTNISYLYSCSQSRTNWQSKVYGNK